MGKLAHDLSDPWYTQDKYAVWSAHSKLYKYMFKITSNRILALFCCPKLYLFGNITDVAIRPGWRHQIEAFSAYLGFCEGVSTGHRWIPLTKASGTEIWFAPGQTFEQTLRKPVIWDTIALIMTSLQCLQNVTKLNKPTIDWPHSTGGL